MLLQETRGNAVIDYSYDASGTLYALRYKANATDAGTYYYYARNWRGDIIGLYDDNGTLIATYDYNAWGKPQSVEDANGTVITDQTHIAHINPFRYRGYYYDTETGLYYLQSRYYDPLTGRFINADVYCDTCNSVLSTNMFAYCENNAVNKVDSSGCDAIWLQHVSGVAGMGHTGLLVEYKGKWYYWYWGPAVLSAILGYAAQLHIMMYYPSSRLSQKFYLLKNIKIRSAPKLLSIANKEQINSKTRIKDINKIIKNEYSGKFQSRIYFYGNFASTYNYLLEQKKVYYYNLITNNCMQTCALALYESTKNTHFLTARNLVIPNLAFAYLVARRLV